MAHNRMSNYFPQAAAPQSGVPAGFVVCPVVSPLVSPLAMATAQQDLYRQAREEAERQLARSTIDRALFSIWN